MTGVPQVSEVHLAQGIRSGATAGDTAAGPERDELVMRLLFSSAQGNDTIVYHHTIERSSPLGGYSCLSIPGAGFNSCRQLLFAGFGMLPPPSSLFLVYV